jgi:predicted transcriptional regulator
MQKGQSREDSSEPKRKRANPVKDAMAKKLANLKPFKPGQSGNPKGRRKGQRDYRTLFWVALEHIANNHEMTAEEVEEALHVAGITKALKGDFFFHQEILNRVYGKPTDKMDVTSGGKTLAEVIAAATHARRGNTTKSKKAN